MDEVEKRQMSERTKKAPKLSPGGRTTFPCLSTPADEVEEEAKRKRQTANRAALGRARKVSGNAAPGRRSAAAFEERLTPTNGANRYMHELSRVCPKSGLKFCVK